MSTHFPPKPQYLRYVDASNEASTSEVESARPVYIADLPSGGGGGGGSTGGNAEVWAATIEQPGGPGLVRLTYTRALGSTEGILQLQAEGLQFDPDASSPTGSPTSLGIVLPAPEDWPTDISVQHTGTGSYQKVPLYNGTLDSLPLFKVVVNLRSPVYPEPLNNQLIITAQTEDSTDISFALSQGHTFKL